MWRGAGAQPVLGQTILVVKSKPVLTDPKIIEIKPDEPDIPFPHYPVNVNVEYARKVLHNFSTSPFAGIKVRVEFSGQATDKSGGGGGTLLQFRVKDVEREIRWTGVTGKQNKYFTILNPVWEINSE